MTDNVFGELEYDGGFVGKLSLDCFGDTEEVDIIIQADDEEDGIADVQYAAFEAFQAKWNDIQNDILERILEYYNDEEKGAYGPEDEEEFREWWPDIGSREDLIPLLHIDSVVIANDYLMEDGRKVYVLFDRDWGGEDLEDNGVAVGLVDEAVEEVGYKDIAF